MKNKHYFYIIVASLMLGAVASECHAQKKLTDYFNYNTMIIKKLETGRSQAAFGLVELFYDEQAKEIHVYADDELMLELENIYAREEDGRVYFSGVDGLDTINSGFFDRYEALWRQGTKFHIKFVK